MATSSITKSFVISGPEQVELFVKAIEASAKDRPKPVSLSAREITDEVEMADWMSRWEKNHIAER